LIIRGFELEGAAIFYPFSIFIRNPETGKSEQVEQIDGAVFSDSFACLIESKAENKPKNFEAIAKIRSQLLRRPSFTIGSVFSVTGFTEPAVTLTMQTAPQPILLWNGDDVEFALKEYEHSERGMRWGLMIKYRYLVARVNPSYALINEGYRSE
jgi:hypothetical protein